MSGIVYITFECKRTSGFGTLGLKPQVLGGMEDHTGQIFKDISIVFILTYECKAA